MSVNEESTAKMVEFGAKQNKMFTQYTRILLETPCFDDVEKMAMLRSRVQEDRAALNKFERNLPWEDE